MKRILGIVVPILILLTLVGYRVVAKTTSEAQMKQQGAARRNAPTVVSVTVAGPKDIGSVVDAVGTLESPYQVNLAPNIAGRIDYLQVREGDPVTAGEVLARIDPQYVEGQILQAQGNVAAAEQRLAEARVTQNANAVGINSTVAQQKAAVSSAVADYNETRDTLDATIGAAHNATLDAEAKVAAATSAVQTAEANLRLAQANLEDAQAKYSRTYSLYTQGFDSAQDLDDVRASVKVNQATVNAQEKNVEAARSALVSAQALARAAANQESIARKKGQSDISDAKAKLTQAQRTLDSAVANRANIPAYVENLKALDSEVVAAKASLNQAIAQRAYLIVKSPIEGTVTRRLFDPGAEASPGSPLLIVQYLRWLFVTAALPVEYSDQVRTGMDLAITLDAFPGRTFHGKITYINKSADPTNRQFMIRTKLDNPDGSLRPGMYAKVELITSYIRAPIAVPREGITTDASNNSTATVVDSKNVAHVVPVTLGVQDSTNVQVLSGINAGDRVIVLSYRAVPDGARVSIGTWGLNRPGRAGRVGKSDRSVAASAADSSGTQGAAGSAGR